MRVGLVLGAGGVLGASWLIGTLETLADQTGWDPRAADYIVGTSAGSVIGALTSGGVSPHDMARSITGEPMPELEEIERIDGEAVMASEGTEYRMAWGLPIGPGSWRMALSTLRHPLSHSPSAVVSGWIPRGFMRTEPIGALVRRFVPGEWPEHPNYWAVACDYTTGRRVAFGREDAPPARVQDAVQASCAIPGFYRPVTIGGRRYVDGGVCSPSNLDLLAGRELDLVVCLNPISSRARMSNGGAVERFAAGVRAATGRRLGHEARKLRAEGTEVVILQPTLADLEIMGVNLMARSRRVQVLQRARETARGEIRTLREAGLRLPGDRAAPAAAAPRSRPRGATAA